MSRRRSRAAPRERTASRRRFQRGASWPSELTWDDRVSDHVNPILVRDLVQTGHSLLVSVAILAVSFALIQIGASMLASGPVPPATLGRIGFEDLAVLVAVVCWAFVPFLTFLSMREEVTGAAAEALLLSGLTPTRVVLGKVLSGLLLAIVIVSLGLPLFGLSFVLQAVSLPMLLLTLAFGMLGTVTLAVVAVAAACACQVFRPRALPIALAAAGFGALGLGADTLVRVLLLALEDTVASRGVFAVGAAAIALLYVAAAAWCAGTASLAHAHDNRSTGFRIVGLTLPLTTGFWLWATAAPADVNELAPAAAWGIAVLTAPLWACAATEGRGRLRRGVVPSSPLVRVLAAPFAPGRSNGLLWVLLLAAALAALGFGLPALQSGAGAAVASPAGRHTSAVCGLAILYLLLYCGLGAGVRVVLERREDARAWWLARAALPLVALGSWAVPLVFNGIRGIRSVEWNLAHFPNPLTTGAQVAREGMRPDLLLWLGGVVVLLWVPWSVSVVAAIGAAWRGPDHAEPTEVSP